VHHHVHRHRRTEQGQDGNGEETSRRPTHEQAKVYSFARSRRCIPSRPEANAIER
jgi:hypothetical protein